MNEDDDQEFLIDPFDSTLRDFSKGYDEAPVPPTSKNSIMNEIINLPLPDDIKNQADIIWGKMGSRIHKGKVRRQKILYCTYCAYLELGLPINIEQLRELFKLTSKEAYRCNSLFSPSKTGYTPPLISSDPRRLIPDICRDIGISEYIEVILKLAENLLKKDKSLVQYAPQGLVGGILKYFVMINGINLDPNIIAKTTGRVNSTLDAMCVRIGLIDNS